MSDPRLLLTALQQGDSFLPTGAVALSWGLETLRAEGIVATPAELDGFVDGQLEHRWASFDRVALVASHRAGEALHEVASIDRRVEACTFAREMREGSRRAGQALLALHARLATPQASAYDGMVKAGAAPGHLAPAQGLLWRALGMDETTALCVSAYSFAVALQSAALRLGVIGHVHAQRALARMRSKIAALLATPVPPLAELGAWAPQTDIASMRHEIADARLFAN
ncbi:MAG TPA: urease accessory UreF family protein [Geminicoccaceae bacterium]